VRGADGLRGADGPGVGDGITSVNGDVGPVIVLDAADIGAAGPLGATTIQQGLDLLAAQVGGLIVIDSVASLEAMFPAVLGVYTIDKQTIWVSPTGASIVLGAAESISIVHPGSIEALGASKVNIEGDFVGPLLSGELNLAGISVKNINAAGSDVLCESLAGRQINWRDVALRGQTAGVVQNCLGISAFENVSIAPGASGAIGLVIDGVIAIAIWSTSGSISQGVVSHTAWTILATAVVAIVLRFDRPAIGTTGDFMFYVDVAATLPGGSPPTNVFGVEVSGGSVKAGALFDPAGLDQTDIRILSLGNTGAPDSQFIGDLILDTTGTPAPTPVSQVYVASNAWEVMPSNNASIAPNGVTLAATPANERHTLTITSLQVWSMRYDGPEDQRTDRVSWSAQGRRSGGAATVVDVQLQFNDGGGWTNLPETRDTISALSTVPQKISGTAVVLNNNGYELRLVSRTSSNATNTLWDKFRVSKGI